MRVFQWTETETETEIDNCCSFAHRRKLRKISFYIDEDLSWIRTIGQTVLFNYFLSELNFLVNATIDDKSPFYGLDVSGNHIEFTFFSFWETRTGANVYIQTQRFYS